MGSSLCTGRNRNGRTSHSEMSDGPWAKEPSPGSYSVPFPNSSYHKSSVAPLRDRGMDSHFYYGTEENAEEGTSGRAFTRSTSNSPAQKEESEESTVPSMHPVKPRPIRWKKGEIIGSGAYGRVYMGMNLDNGELIAVKQVLVAIGGANSKKAQDHLRSLEEEVDLLRDLSHPNIVRYLGTQREDEALNIFLEFVPGGSISSLLSKFGCFTEKVIKKYTRQILLGLDYLHRHKIMHRDIKGANILVDNRGGIKLADFGASKKLADLATVSHGNRSLRGTPYWMAPEVIKQTGHGRQADIWSVGCTVLEMATGKPPWSEYQSDVAALFHIAQSESPPPIPSNLSAQASDFILACLQRDPRMRPSASELLKHPFLFPELDSPLTNGSSTGASNMQRQVSISRATGRSPSPNPTDVDGDGHSLPRGALSMDEKESLAQFSPLHDSSPRKSLFPRYYSGENTKGGSQWEASTSGHDNTPPPAALDVRGLSMGRRDGEQSRGKQGYSHVSSNMSFRSDFNPMEEPSFVEASSAQDWDSNSEDEVTGPPNQGSPQGPGQSAGATSTPPLTDIEDREISRFSEPRSMTGGESDLQSRGDTEGTEDHIQRFLQDKASELKRMEELISERSDAESSLAREPHWPGSESRAADSWRAASTSVEGAEDRGAESSELRAGDGGVIPLVECASPKMAGGSRRVLGYKPYFGNSSDPRAEGSGSSKKQRWEEELQSELASKRGKKKHSSHSTESGSGDESALSRGD